MKTDAGDDSKKHVVYLIRVQKILISLVTSSCGSLTVSQLYIFTLLYFIDRTLPVTAALFVAYEQAPCSRRLIKLFTPGKAI